MKHNVLLSLAGNFQQKRNLAEARERLLPLFEQLTFTHERWTKPIGNSRPCRYLNQLAKGTTDMDADTLQACLKKMEKEMGRTPEEREQGIVRIDLDLLLFDQQRYHERDWERDYIRRLLDDF